MNRPASHLLEFAPPVLEIRGFTAPTGERLRQAFLDTLQQPTYVNRLVLEGADPQGNRTPLVQSFRLTLPIGLILAGTMNATSRVTVEELSHCCLAGLWGRSCSRCRTVFQDQGFSTVTVYYDRYFRLRPGLTEEEREEIGDPGMERFRDSLTERLTAVPGVDVLSATIITEELLDFFLALASSNRDNGE